MLALELVDRACAAGIAFRALVAGCLYGDHNEFVGQLQGRQIPYVLAHRGTVGLG